MQCSRRALIFEKSYSQRQVAPSLSAVSERYYRKGAPSRLLPVRQGGGALLFGVRAVCPGCSRPKAGVPYLLIIFTLKGGPLQSRLPLRWNAAWKTLPLTFPFQIRIHFVLYYKTIRVLGGGGVGEETLLQKGPSPTKDFNFHQSNLRRGTGSRGVLVQPAGHVVLLAHGNGRRHFFTANGHGLRAAGVKGAAPRH